jgi:predicted HAD superfamily hydrolase
MGQIVQSGASVSVIANQFKIVKIKLKSLIFILREQYLVQQIYSTE